MYRLIMSIALLSAASPAVAQTRIPEPSDAALFVIAVVGLIVGRQASRKRSAAPDEASDDA